MLASVLDGVAGLGPVRKKSIRKHFKSFAALKSARLEDIEQVKGIPHEVAEELYRVLQQYSETHNNSSDEK